MYKTKPSCYKILPASYLAFVLGVIVSSKDIPRDISIEPYTWLDIISVCLFVISIWISGYLFYKKD